MLYRLVHGVIQHDNIRIENLNKKFTMFVHIRAAHYISGTIFDISPWYDSFFGNTMSAIAAYCCFPKKPAIQIVKYADNQLTLF